MLLISNSILIYQASNQLEAYKKTSQNSFLNQANKKIFDHHFGLYLIIDGIALAALTLIGLMCFYSPDLIGAFTSSVVQKKVGEILLTSVLCLLVFESISIVGYVSLTKELLRLQQNQIDTIEAMKDTIAIQRTTIGLHEERSTLFYSLIRVFTGTRNAGE